jgi:hypothetical protein
MPRKRSRKQLRYALQGIATGLIASLTLISGIVMLVRHSIGRHIGHRGPLAFALLTTILVLLVYRFWRAEGEPGRSTRSATHGEVTELPGSDGPLGEHSRKGDRNHTKSA